MRYLKENVPCPSVALDAAIVFVLLAFPLAASVQYFEASDFPYLRKEIVPASVPAIIFEVPFAVIALPGKAPH